MKKLQITFLVLVFVGGCVNYREAFEEKQKQIQEEHRQQFLSIYDSKVDEIKTHIISDPNKTESDKKIMMRALECVRQRQVCVGQPLEIAQLIFPEKGSEGHWWRISKDSSGYEIWCYGKYHNYGYGFGDYKPDYTFYFEDTILTHWIEW